MSRWGDRGDVPRGADYDARWDALIEAGESVHGEADLVCHLLDGLVGPAGPDDAPTPPCVMDAGCGTGRVAVELAGRGIDVVGVDLDEGMLDTAIAKAPELDWCRADLVDVDVGRSFDVIVMAGNVVIFLAAGTEAAVLANLARHLRLDGLLVAGFQLRGGIDLDTYDRHAAAAGLETVDRWATWDREPFDGGDYAVSVHRRT